ncbi:hypothetical protein P8605_40340, partial [Streptomyces sp. T-3]|nr:hypothetical protein [Streptomyces sp. T-3]
VAPQRTAPVAGAAPAVHLPGSEAEANSNVLPGRSGGDAVGPKAGEDPVIAAAERALREADVASEAELVVEASPEPVEVATSVEVEEVVVEADPEPVATEVEPIDAPVESD